MSELFAQVCFDCVPPTVIGVGEMTAGPGQHLSGAETHTNIRCVELHCCETIAGESAADQIARAQAHLLHMGAADKKERGGCFLGEGEVAGTAWVILQRTPFKPDHFAPGTKFSLIATVYCESMDVVGSLRLYNMTDGAELAGSVIAGIEGATPYVVYSAEVTMPASGIKVVELQGKLTTEDGANKMLVDSGFLCYQ